MSHYIWQQPDWSHFRFDTNLLAEPLALVHRAQGQLMGKMEKLGLAQREQTTLHVLTQEVLTTSAIEGERFDGEVVRSSIARKLGMDIGGH